MKSKILLALLFAFSLKLSAQTGVGFHLGGSYYFGLKPMVNLGGNFIVPIKENPIEFGLSYHLPFSITSTDYANPFSSANSQITVDVKERFAIWDIRASYRYYFNDNEFEDGGWYAQGGVALGIGTDNVSVLTNYDKSQYYVSDFYSNSKHVFIQPYLHVVLGYDKVLDNDQMMGGQLYVNITNSTYNSRTGSSEDVTIPGCIGLRLTYTLPLGN